MEVNLFIIKHIQFSKFFLRGKATKMGDKILHPVRFSKEQVDFIERMVYASGYYGETHKGILSTIEKSVKKGKKVSTKGKTLDNIKRALITGWPLYILPPAEKSTLTKPEEEVKVKKCHHLNMRFKTNSRKICPDCHRTVWPSDMINIILDAIHDRLPGS